MPWKVSRLPMGSMKIPGPKEVPVMQATMQLKSESLVEDQYLGFEIELQDGYYVAKPLGWTGEVLLAESMPRMRKKIWRWWHQVQ
jgi:hypothetical protein